MAPPKDIMVSKQPLRLMTSNLTLPLTDLHGVPHLGDDLGDLLDPLVDVGADGAEDLHEGLHEGRSHPRAPQQVLNQRDQVATAHLSNIRYSYTVKVCRGHPHPH